MDLKYTNSYHIHNKERIIVIWSAKAACTTVNHMIFQHEGLLDEALKYSKWIHNYRRLYNSMYNRNKQITRNRHPFTKFIQFTVNPYRRAVSSYIHAMRSKNNYVGLKNKNISFYNFLLRILNGTIKHDPHHDKQTFVTRNYNNIHVVKMENIENELPILNNKFNLHYKLCGNQNVKKKNSNVNYFVGEKNWKKIYNNIPNNYTLFYNKEIRKLVCKIYREDIKNLGYTWDMFVNYEEHKMNRP